MDDLIETFTMRNAWFVGIAPNINQTINGAHVPRFSHFSWPWESKEEVGDDIEHLE